MELKDIIKGSPKLDTRRDFQHTVAVFKKNFEKKKIIPFFESRHPLGLGPWGLEDAHADFIEAKCIISSKLARGSVEFLGSKSDSTFSSFGSVNKSFSDKPINLRHRRERKEPIQHPSIHSEGGCVNAINDLVTQPPDKPERSHLLVLHSARLLLGLYL